MYNYNYIYIYIYVYILKYILVHFSPAAEQEGGAVAEPSGRPSQSLMRERDEWRPPQLLDPKILDPNPKEQKPEMNSCQTTLTANPKKFYRYCSVTSGGRGRPAVDQRACKSQDSSKGGAVETGGSDVYDVMDKLVT